MRPVERIADADDPRVAAYLGIRERDLVGHGRRFVAEGEIVLSALVGSRFAIESVFLLDTRLARLAPLLEALPDVPVYTAERAVMDRVVGFPIHRGVLAVGQRGAETSPENLLAGLGPRALVVGLVGLANHDNVGGVFRNAAAFAADAVLLDGTTCDPLYRKAIRVSAAASLLVAFARASSAGALVDVLDTAGYDRGAEPKRRRNPPRDRLRRPHGPLVRRRRARPPRRHPGAHTLRPGADGARLRLPERRYSLRDRLVRGQAGGRPAPVDPGRTSILFTMIVPAGASRQAWPEPEPPCGVGHQFHQIARMRLPEPAFEKPETSVPGGVSAPSAGRILQPGRNCWRISRAAKAAVMSDGGPYFAHLEDALRQAKRSVMIVGWDFDGRIRLRPDASPKESPELGPLLRSLVEARPELEVRILVWSVAVLHAPGAPLPLLFGAAWQEHPRITLKLDTRHPLYAAHHQKIVCIDGGLAFVGGIDLTVRRWDRHPHTADDPVRLQPDGTPYSPVHDVQMAVQGAAARDVCALASRRWHDATGEDLPDPSGPDDIWPRGLSADLTDTPVAIVRTAPPWNEEPPVNEAAILAVDALKAARKTIYIEAQYMTAAYIGDVLVESLRQETGPEIVVLMTHESRGLLERLLMGRNRDHLIRRMKRADRHGRLLVSYPIVPKADGSEQQVLVHSKLIMVDDVFLRVGSSNLNNRSFGLDTECDLAIEATTEAERATILRIRDALLAEHLGVDPETVTAVTAETGSVIGAVNSLNTGPCRLRPFEAMSGEGPTRPVFGTRLLDPKKPFEPLWFLRRRKRRRPLS